MAPIASLTADRWTVVCSAGSWQVRRAGDLSVPRPPETCRREHGDEQGPGPGSGRAAAVRAASAWVCGAGARRSIGARLEPVHGPVVESRRRAPCACVPLWGTPAVGECAVTGRFLPTRESSRYGLEVRSLNY